LKRPTTDSQQALRDELAEMARTGASKPVRSDSEGKRHPAHATAGPIDLTAAQAALNAARSKQIALFVGLMVMMAVPICLPATPVVIGGMGISFAALMAYLFKINREHRAAFVTVHMAKGMSEREANTAYDNTYSGD
jgi:hypothetical protein